MKQTLFFSAILCTLLAACKQKPSTDRAYYWGGPTTIGADRNAQPSFQVGTITKVTVVFMERLASGKDSIVAQTTRHIAVPADTASVNLSDSSSFTLHVPIRVIAKVEVDLDGDGKADKTMKLRYVGQKIGDHLDAECGNPIIMASQEIPSKESHHYVHVR